MKCNIFKMTQLKIKVVKEVAELLEIERKTVSHWKAAFMYEGEVG